MIVEMIFLADKLLHLPLRHGDYLRRAGVHMYLEALARRRYIYLELKFAEVENGRLWQVGGVSML